MRKFRRYLIALAILAVFLFLAGPAAAVDVKFSGQWRFEGWYEQNRNLVDQGTGAISKNSAGFFDSSLLLTTQFRVAEGLSITTRARILDKIWGDKTGTGLRDASGGTAMDTQNRPYATDRLLRENIEFERVYATFKALKGQFDIGYQKTASFGTPFNDTDDSRPLIKYGYRTGPWNFSLAWQKETESEVRLQNNGTGGNSTATTPSFTNQADVDYDQWKYSFTYAQSNWDAGFSGTWYNDKSHRSATGTAYSAQWHKLNPYARGTFGPLYAEAEVTYLIGDKYDYENTANVTSQDRRGWAWYAKAIYNFGPAYIGGQYAFVQGDDPGTAGRDEAGFASGREYKPCLILLNSDRDKYLGALGLGSMAVFNNNFISKGSTNFSLYQGFVGYKPLAKLDLMASYTFVKLDQKPAGYTDDKVGNELDLTATYKLYDNLAYMVGFGYLWAGDAWKGNTTRVVGNDWLLLQRLTLNF